MAPTNLRLKLNSQKIDSRDLCQTLHLVSVGLFIRLDAKSSMQKRLYVFYNERLQWTSEELVQAGWRVGEQFIGRVQGLYRPKVDGCGMREKARLR